MDNTQWTNVVEVPRHVGNGGFLDDDLISFKDDHCNELYYLCRVCNYLSDYDELIWCDGEPIVRFMPDGLHVLNEDEIMFDERKEIWQKSKSS